MCINCAQKLSQDLAEIKLDNEKLLDKMELLTNLLGISPLLDEILRDILEQMGEEAMVNVLIISMMESYVELMAPQQELFTLQSASMDLESNPLEPEDFGQALSGTLAHDVDIQGESFESLAEGIDAYVDSLPDVPMKEINVSPMEDCTDDLNKYLVDALLDKFPNAVVNLNGESYSAEGIGTQHTTPVVVVGVEDLSSLRSLFD